MEEGCSCLLQQSFAPASFAEQSCLRASLPLGRWKDPALCGGHLIPKPSSSGAHYQRAPLHSKKECLPKLPSGCDDNPLKRSRTEPWRSCSWDVPEVHRRPGFPCAWGCAVFSEFAALRRLCIKSSDSRFAIPVLVYLSESREKAVRQKSIQKWAEYKLLSFSRLATSDSLATPWTVAPLRLLCLWDFSGENAGVGCHFLLQGIFPAPGWNPRLLGLLPWQMDSSPLSHLGSLHVSHTCFKVCLAQSQIVSVGTAMGERLGAV